MDVKFWGMQIYSFSLLPRARVTRWINGSDAEVLFLRGKTYTFDAFLLPLKLRTLFGYFLSFS